jgi:hypothetical protein
VIGLVCHRRLRFVSAKLDASVEASGPHDFAVRLGAVRQRHLRVHRIPPRVRDDRDTPLWWDETARTTVVICPAAEVNYFAEGDWTTQITLIVFNKIGCGQNGTSGPKQR